MFKKSASSEDVRKYYNAWMDRYEQSYGNIIQAFRPQDDKLLIDDLLQSLQLKSEGHYLDAGCGVGGVAIPFVQKVNCRIDGITISDAQVQKAFELVSQNNLSHKINIRHGDYHHLSKQFGYNIFDGVYFMESLGHSPNPVHVLKEAITVLRPGGFVYIKDFYVRESEDKKVHKMYEKVIRNINHHYKYNVMRLDVILKAIRSMDVKLNFIKSFDFQNDISVRSDFESKNDIDLFQSKTEFMPADWYEIKFTKY